ncbi:MAG: hypothetical protein ACLUNV_08585 [Sutterella wadsworthensis]
MKMGRAGKIAMPDFDEFWKKGYVMFDVADKDRNYVAFEAFRKDPKANALSTESGLIQLYSPKIASYGYDDCKGHPCFFVADRRRLQSHQGRASRPHGLQEPLPHAQPARRHGEPRLRQHRGPRAALDPSR